MSLQCVLLAEDELIIGVDLCDTVEEAGYEVQGPYESASAAIASLEQRKPDLAILDVRLEDGTAYSLAERLMAQNVPVIFQSGEVSPGEVHGRYPGALACSKPCPPNEMIKLVQQALATA
jgi:DNA-binding response OmpR family regulator